MAYRQLRLALNQRSPPVSVSDRVVRTWSDKYAVLAKTRKRPAAAPASGIHKRPASASTAAEADADVAVSELQSLADATAIEEAIGSTYRRDYANKGLGLDRSSMRQILLGQGYDCAADACKPWLRRYARGSVDQPEGNYATYALVRQDLLRWYHVEKLNERELQTRCSEELGFWPHADNLYA